MKKLVFLFVAFAAVSFASCGNKAAQSDESADSTVQVVVEEETSEPAPEANDSTAEAPADSTAQVAE
jgi:hypothetical protein